ncbi:MAG: alpha/beta fold hydrolase [Actinomycetota bacterium]
MSTAQPNSPRPTFELDLEILEATVEAMTAASSLGPLDAEDMASAREDVANHLVNNPGTVFKHAAELGLEHLRIALGVADVEPDPKDRRFSDDWFSSVPWFKRLAQAQVANERAASALLDDLDFDGKGRLRADFVMNAWTSAMSPTNSLFGNPAAIKEAWRTGGASLLQGAQNALTDLTENGGMPKMVDTEPFVAGETIAATPGAVVHRHPLLEVLQYTPTTGEVHGRPVVIVPPQINKYYVLDLAPGRSLAEHLVANGQQVFMISWRNPGPEFREHGLDDYLDAVLEATDVALDITGSPDLNLLGVCAGGITASALAGHLAAIGDERLNSLSLLVTILDWDVPSTMGSFALKPLPEASRVQSEATGVLSGEELAKTFAWMRPNDLVWNYWSNNYLQGKQPPAFDVLAWNVDSTNLPAALHGDFLSIAANNSLTTPGTLVAKATPVDLGAVTCDSYVVGAVTDHITPWEACYESVRLLGGRSEFVLSSQGHIQALVNPPGNPKGSFRINPDAIDLDEGPSSEQWLEGAATHAGSWWDHWAVWLGERAGQMTDAPTDLGSADHPVLGEAPGLYVFD